MKTFFQKIFGTKPETSQTPAALLTKELAGYQKSRVLNSTQALCNAPLNSMYFNVFGQVAPCWLTLDKDDTYPEKSIREIWDGPKFMELRRELASYKFPEKCKVCSQNVSNGNYHSVLSKLYDHKHEIIEYPTVMEFELSNKCNLACVMCKGELSSTIRKVRDELPELQSPYDNNFTKQLEEFIPYLREAKFLGGEPFLIDVYYEIWDRIIEINPKVEITITTNGTAYNGKIERVLESLRCNIIISIDSFFKETYEKIRLRGNYERVMENLEKFRSYTKENQLYFGVSINPLRKNWKELADYINICNEKGASVWFNTVTYPYKEALWSLPSADLDNIYSLLKGTELMPYQMHWDKSVYENNCTNWRNFVDVQLSNWLQEALDREAHKRALLKVEDSDSILIKLKKNLEEYITTDAYISSVVKTRMIKNVYKNIEAKSLKQNTELLNELYLLNEEICLMRLGN